MPQENTANRLCYPRAARITGIAPRPVAAQSYISRPLVIGGALALLALGVSGCRRTATKTRTTPKPRTTSKPPGNYSCRTLADFGGPSSSLENLPPITALGGITPGPDGNLYGTLKDGGKERGGALYRFTPGTNTVTILTEFGKNGGDADKVSFGGDGLLYGTINGLERGNKGCLYHYDIKSGAYKILVVFGSSDKKSGAAGIHPSGSVIMGRDGSLYGVTSDGGTGKSGNLLGSGGTLYKVDARTGACTTLVNFGTASVAGSRPSGEVAQGSDGSLYGTTAFGGRGKYGTLYRYDPATRVCATLFEFDDPNTFGTKSVVPPAGYSPDGGVVVDSDNNLYGATSAGGTYGGGVLYRFHLATHTLTPLVQFGGGAAKGKQPDGRLCWDKAGWLYGTTLDGGAGGSEIYSTAGTLFRYNVRANEFQTLVDFHTREVSPQGPVAGIAIAADGTLYGTTMEGGKWGGGVLYGVTPPAR